MDEAPTQPAGSSSARTSAPRARRILFGRWLRLWVRSFVGIDGVHVVRVKRRPLSRSRHAASLAFERSILAPLLGGTPTSYEHPRDYNRFFRAIAEHRSYFARDRSSGSIIGSLTGVAWRLRLPGGGRRRAVYLMRYRIAPAARTGPAMLYLLARIMPFVALYGRTTISILQFGHAMKQDKIAAAIGMPGPRRAGAFRVITWNAHRDDGPSPGGLLEAPERAVRARFAALTSGCIAVAGGKPDLRSAMTPRWLLAADGSACGCIEDYSRALTWRTPEGPRPLEAHVSFFGWTSIEAGSRFFRACMPIAAAAGATRIRAVIDERHADAFIAAVGLPPEADVGWSIMATGGRPFPDAPWVVHPSEI